MKLKTGLKYSTNEFWSDLDGGMLNPAEILENPEDVQRVQNAIAVVQEFRVACEEQIPGFNEPKGYFTKR